MSRKEAPPIQYRLAREPDTRYGDGCYPVTIDDRSGVLLGIVARIDPDTGTRGPVMWAACSSTGAYLSDVNVASKREAAQQVAEGAEAREIANGHANRRVQIRQQGSGRDPAWAVLGAGIYAMKARERPRPFRTRADAFAWAVARDLWVTR